MFKRTRLCRVYKSNVVWYTKSSAFEQALTILSSKPFLFLNVLFSHFTVLFLNERDVSNKILPVTFVCIISPEEKVFAEFFALQIVEKKTQNFVPHGTR